MDYESYAIWWVPLPGTALARFGAEWTGWCADRGVISSEPATAASAGEGPTTARSLVRRGLHASLGAPFRLAPGRSCWALEDALAGLAERTEPIILPPLKLTFFDGRAVLALARPERVVAALAAAVAEAVRPFGLPQPAPGGAQGDGIDDPACPTSSLDRLHLPLTDRLDPGRAYAVAVELEGRLAPVLARRQRIADLALVGDPGGGRPWRLLQRLALSGEPARRDARVPDGMAWRGPSLLAPLAGAARGATTT